MRARWIRFFNLFRPQRRKRNPYLSREYVRTLERMQRP